MAQASVGFEYISYVLHNYYLILAFLDVGAGTQSLVQMGKAVYHLYTFTTSA